MLPLLAVLLAGASWLPAQTMGELVAKGAPCDLDGDGIAEVERLEWLDGAGAAESPRVVVLVEARLLQERAGIEAAQVASLRERLRCFIADLAAAGARAELVAATVCSGPLRQDGATLLGLRRFLQACRDAGPLAGALLVGHFPEALLLRTCNWRKQGEVDLPDADGKSLHFGGETQYLRRVTELVAHRCELVLADLDGDWEACYRRSATEYPGVIAAFASAVPELGGAYVAWKPTHTSYSDAFHVDDGAATVDAEHGTLLLDDAARDHECTAADRAHGNPIAQPEIAVSRIDARGVAWSPLPRLLDEQGRPQAVTFAADEPLPTDLWQPDPGLELRLLIDYFDRNHRFRTSPRVPEQEKPAAIAWRLGSGMAAVRAGGPAWHDFAADGYDVHQGVDLCALTSWLQRPALFRTLRAHSDGRFSAFARTDPAQLEAQAGAPWCWQLRDRVATPSLAAECRGGRADVFFYRTLWQNHALPDVPYLLVHTGCEAISPPGAGGLPYVDPEYDRGQQAEALLFFTPCLALIGRAKVFYDEPRGFSEVLAAGGSFGAAWQRYFALEADATSWNGVGGDISRKRAYFWSLLGDWTLRLWGEPSDPDKFR